MTTLVLEEHVKEWSNSKGSTPAGRGANDGVWVEDENGTRWLWKARSLGTFVDVDGFANEARLAALAREVGLLSYDVMQIEARGGRVAGVLIQHVEDANPGWRMIGHPYDWTWSKHHDRVADLPASAWLPAAVFGGIGGIGDRHNGNAVVVQHEDTGELRVISVDHEMGQSHRPNWPDWVREERMSYMGPALKVEHYNRPHHQRASHWAVLAEVVDQVMAIGEHLDPHVVDTFIDCVRSGLLGHVTKGVH